MTVRTGLIVHRTEVEYGYQLSTPYQTWGNRNL